MSRIHVGGATVEYLEFGRGQPVVLLHSTGASGAQWRSLGERLAEDFHVVAPDLCGYGSTSGWSGPGTYSLAHEAMLVGALLDRFDEPVHLVGHSYGGAVAMHLARTQAQRIRSLALYEPAAFHLLRDGDPHDEIALREISDVASSIRQVVASGDHDDGAAVFVDYWSGAGTWATMPASRQQAVASRLPKVALDFQAAFHEPSNAHDFAHLRMPTLLMQGDRSPGPGQRICARLAQSMPNVRRYSILRGAGHMAPVTHREAVNLWIEAHLDACSAPHQRLEFA